MEAPVEEVWDFLVDPRRVVGCVPGGELDAVLDERVFDGRVRVDVGAWTMAYRGRVRLAEVDVAARSVRIVGQALESAGAGSARLTLDSSLTALPGGRTGVAVHARVEMAGGIVRPWRGLLDHVARQVFQQFTASVRAAAGRPAVPGAAPAQAGRREPLRAIPLLARALRAWVAGLVRPRRSGSRAGKSSAGSEGGPPRG
ncbi:MAG TPA: SRPBCC domain-containing protein [Anaeromyxobacteraceae bacterium]